MLALAGCGGTQTAQTARPTAPPDRDTLVELLRAFATVPFSEAARERGCPADETIYQYVGRLVEYGLHGDGPDAIHALAGGCAEWPAEADRLPVDPPYSAAHWYCKLDAQTSDPAGESPWHYDLRFRMHRTERSIDLATAGCAGTP